MSTRDNDNKKVALVTGANQGIGQEVARQLAQDHDIIVLVGARDLSKGQTTADAIGKNAHAIQIDVTDAASIAAAAERVTKEFGRLDILVNNAGITNVPNANAIADARPSTAPVADVRAVFETNVFGVIAVTQAFLPLLRVAPAGRIVNVSSAIGSLALVADPKFAFRQVAGAYSASKTALNAVTLSFAIELESTPIKVNAVCPGYVATALNGFAGPRTVAQGATEIIRLALLGPDGPTGAYRNEDGPIAW